MSPSPSLIDAPVTLDARGLPHDRSLRLRASWTAFGGKRWRSSVPVHSDGSGRLHLTGLGGMRFLWTMRADHPAPGGDEMFGAPATGPSPVAIEVADGDRVLARTTLVRRVSTADISVRTLRGRIDGFFFSRPGTGRHPGVVLIGGSEGGYGMVDEAALLAAHGYPSLALAYFRAPGRPPALHDIPLEYFERAGRWLASRPGVDPRHVVMMGASRGGEGALLVASSFPRVFHGAVGLVPSNLVFGALRAQGSAWTLAGRPVRPYTEIPVERISGPVLVAGAGEDALWGSAASSEDIERHLSAVHFPHRHEAFVARRAGHDLGGPPPYLPQPDPLRWGGDPAAGAAAKVRLWQKILAFMRRL